MRNRNLLTLFAIAAAILGNSLCVDAAEYSDKDISEIINKDDGVYLIKQDDKGKISSCVAVVSEEVRFMSRDDRFSAARERRISAKLKIMATAKISELLNPENVKIESEEIKSSDGKVIRSYKKTMMSTSISGVKVIALVDRETKKGDMKKVLVLAWDRDWAKAVDKISKPESSKRLIKNKNKQ